MTVSNRHSHCLNILRKYGTLHFLTWQILWKKLLRYEYTFKEDSTTFETENFPVEELFLDILVSIHLILSSHIQKEDLSPDFQPFHSVSNDQHDSTRPVQNQDKCNSRIKLRDRGRGRIKKNLNYLFVNGGVYAEYFK